MDIISIDLGKKNSYVVVEKDGSVIKEGYTVTTKEGFSEIGCGSRKPFADRPLGRRLN